jgi:hypothetical protein
MPLWIPYGYNSHRSRLGRDNRPKLFRKTNISNDVAGLYPIVGRFGPDTVELFTFVTLSNFRRDWGNDWIQGRRDECAWLLVSKCEAVNSWSLSETSRPQILCIWSHHETPEENSPDYPLDRGDARYRIARRLYIRNGGLSSACLLSRGTLMPSTPALFFQKFQDRQSLLEARVSFCFLSGFGSLRFLFLR